MRPAARAPRMRAILLTLALLGAALAVVPAAEAHDVYCPIGDFGCWAKCKISHREVNVLYEDSHCRWIYGP